MNTNEPEQPSATARDLDLAREEYDLTCFWEAMTSSDLEGAYMSRDEERKRWLNDRLAVTHRIRSRAWERLDAAQRAAAPSFEQLLADPTLQFDKNGEVLASILDYGRGKVCMTSMEVRSNTISVGGVVSSSVYLCTKPTPCPDHDDAVAVDDAVGAYEPYGPERCATCGTNLAPNSTPSLTLVRWDGKSNVMLGMFCLDHPPVIASKDRSR